MIINEKRGTISTSEWSSRLTHRGKESCTCNLSFFPQANGKSIIPLKTSQLLRTRMTWNTKMFCENILTTEWHGGLCQIPGRLLEPLTSQAQSRGLSSALQPAPESDTQMFLQQRRGLKVSRPNRPVWTDSLSWESPSNLRARQFECLMLLCDFWNRLRRCKSQEQPFQESKTRFSFLWKTSKIVIWFWMKCRGWSFS